MSPDKIAKISSCQTECTENGETSHEEIENLRDEQPRYPLGLARSWIHH